MSTSYCSVSKLQDSFLIAFVPLKANSQKCLVSFFPNLLDSLGISWFYACFQSRKNRSRKSGVYFLIGRIIWHMTKVSVHSFERVDLQYIGRLRKGLPKPWRRGELERGRGSSSLVFNAYLVFIIFRKALIEFNRVTIWALPVELSVTVMTGQEKERNWSNDSNRCPHDLSYLFRRD